MTVTFKDTMELISLGLEIAGVGVIVAGFLLGTVRSARLLARSAGPEAYATMRSVFGKSVLLGLEILVAADLVRTVAVDPTLDNLWVLLLLVVIRTFLSWSLDVELEGQWPWRKRQSEIDERARGLSGPE